MQLLHLLSEILRLRHLRSTLALRHQQLLSCSLVIRVCLVRLCLLRSLRLRFYKHCLSFTHWSLGFAALVINKVRVHCPRLNQVRLLRACRQPRLKHRVVLLGPLVLWHLRLLLIKAWSRGLIVVLGPLCLHLLIVLNLVNNCEQALIEVVLLGSALILKVFGYSRQRWVILLRLFPVIELLLANDVCLLLNKLFVESRCFLNSSLMLAWSLEALLDFFENLEFLSQSWVEGVAWVLLDRRLCLLLLRYYIKSLRADTYVRLLGCRVLSLFNSPQLLELFLCLGFYLCNWLLVQGWHRKLSITVLGWLRRCIASLRVLSFGASWSSLGLNHVVGGFQFFKQRLLDKVKFIKVHLTKVFALWCFRSGFFLDWREVCRKSIQTLCQLRQFRL